MCIRNLRQRRRRKAINDVSTFRVLYLFRIDWDENTLFFFFLSFLVLPVMFLLIIDDVFVFVGNWPDGMLGWSWVVSVNNEKNPTDLGPHLDTSV